MEKIILKSPPVEMEYSKRIECLKEYIEKWIYSDALLELIQIFGGEFKKSDLLQEDINWLNSFADVWDYRKKQADGGERWNIYDDEFVKEHSPKILQIAECLGLVDNIEPIEIPDYILPLGGAKMSNYDRSVHTKKIVDSSKKPIQNIVSLTGMRPINDIERPYINKYALNSLTEYDVMCAAIEEVFDFSNVKYNQLTMRIQI